MNLIYSNEFRSACVGILCTARCSYLIASLINANCDLRSCRIYIQFEHRKIAHHSHKTKNTTTPTTIKDIHNNKTAKWMKKERKLVRMFAFHLKNTKRKRKNKHNKKKQKQWKKREKEEKKLWRSTIMSVKSECRCLMCCVRFYKTVSCRLSLLLSFAECDSPSFRWSKQNHRSTCQFSLYVQSTHYNRLKRRCFFSL